MSSITKKNNYILVGKFYLFSLVGEFQGLNTCPNSRFFLPALGRRAMANAQSCYLPLAPINLPPSFPLSPVLPSLPPTTSPPTLLLPSVLLLSIPPATHSPFFYCFPHSLLSYLLFSFFHISLLISLSLSSPACFMLFPSSPPSVPLLTAFSPYLPPPPTPSSIHCA